MSSINIKISSPGKVILHGEHSVVYMKPALAAVVGVRTWLHLIQDPSSSVIVLHLDSLDCRFEIPIDEINGLVKKYIQRNPSGLDKEFLLTVVKDVVACKFTDQTSVQVKTLEAIYYLLCGCLITALKKSLDSGYTIRISSQLNIGAGLGSSASFGVTLATAFLILSNHISVKSYKLQKSLELVSSWAFESERLMHGNPSGVDNTACTYGGIVRFVKGEGFSHIEIPKPLNVLLVDTKVSRQTAKLVANVASLRNEFPKVIDTIWDSMEEIVNAAIPIYKTIDANDEQFFKLEQLFRINNNLLKSIGVSHPRLEEIFAISERNTFSSKLTGAGGGGYAIVLLPADYKIREEFATLCKELVQGGYGITETTVGGEGLIVENVL